jgi:hypothetical protein
LHGFTQHQSAVMQLDIDVQRTANEIVSKLEGKYGCKRFLRDGHQTELEERGRLHYEPYELQVFDHIECEWPLFFCYMLLDAYMRNDSAKIAEYEAKLEPLLIAKQIDDDTTAKYDATTCSVVAEAWQLIDWMIG